MIKERGAAFDRVRHAHLVVAYQKPWKTIAANLRIEEVLDAAKSSRLVLDALDPDPELALKLRRLRTRLGPARHLRCHDTLKFANNSLALGMAQRGIELPGEPE